MERYDSCHSIWLLDPEQRRFARLPRGTRLDPGALPGRWEEYHSFEVLDDGSHVLALNEAKTRLLRFWQHTDPCPHCATDRTEELEVEPTEGGTGY